ncbi:hypothetical protein F5141DRAFT_1218692 [Pisolithus sp. B1]|nr:hypothetical protein F5141DRAFT_1218692 [Pisolithus sp. B1]
MDDHGGEKWYELVRWFSLDPGAPLSRSFRRLVRWKIGGDNGDRVTILGYRLDSPPDIDVIAFSIDNFCHPVLQDRYPDSDTAAEPPSADDQSPLLTLANTTDERADSYPS